MTIKSDSFGFLVGDPADWGQALKLWVGIRQDVRDIHRALSATSAAAKRATSEGARTVNAVPRSRGVDVARVVHVTAKAIAQPTAPLKTATMSKDVPRSALIGAAQRDAKGRFISATRAVTPNAPNSTLGNQEQSRDSRGKFDGAASRLAVPGRIGAMGSIASNAIERAPDVDPSIAAAKEVSAIVTPIGRGFGKMFGSGGEEKRKLVWIKRLWSELRGLRRDETEFSKAELRKLTAIEKKPNSGKSGGGLLSRLTPKIPGLGMLGNFLGKGGAGLLGLGKGLLRRVPLLGALLAGGSALASIFGGDDPEKTSTENRKDRFTGGGSGIGALMGGGIGLAFGGPLGAMVGGLIGDKLGEITGAWLATFDWKEVGDKITGTWDAGVKKFSDGWDAIIGFFKDKFEIAKNIANAVKNLAVQAGDVVNDVVKEKTGVDVKANVRGAATAVKNTVTTAADAVDQHVVTPVSAAAGAVASYGQERVKKMAAPIGRAVTNVKDWMLGQTSKVFESGAGGAGTVSTGRGDNGGASYGTYQLSSKMGTLDKFLSSSKYGAQFEGMSPGTKEFNAKWKDIAAADPSFGTAQHDFIKNTQYDPQMDMLRKVGIDLSDRGAGVRDSVWSTSVQFGGKSSLIQSALKGKDVSTMRDADIVAAIQDYKIANNETLFKKSSADVRKGTLARASEEKTRLLGLANTNPMMPMLATTTAVPAVPNVSVTPNMPNIPSVAKMPDIPEMASIASPTQLNTRPSNMSVTVVAPKSDVGQDVRDRGIAHVATGGMSGSRWG
jgi:hypothetical protein